MSVFIVPVDGVSVQQEWLLPFAMELNKQSSMGILERLRENQGKVELLWASSVPSSPSPTKHDDPLDE